MLTPYIDGVYLVDFEFHPVNGVEGNPPEPVCMVVRNLVSGGGGPVYPVRPSRHEGSAF